MTLYDFNRLNLIKSLLVDLLNTKPLNTTGTLINRPFILKDFFSYFNSWLWLYYSNKKELSKVKYYPYRLETFRYNTETILKYIQLMKNEEFIKRYELFKNCINPNTKRPFKKNKATYHELKNKEFSIKTKYKEGFDISYIEEIEAMSKRKDFKFIVYIRENNQTESQIKKINLLINSLFLDFVKCSLLNDITK